MTYDFEKAQAHQKFRADALAYALSKDDLPGLVDLTLHRLLELTSCDYIAIHTVEGDHRLLYPHGELQECHQRCEECAFYKFQIPETKPAENTILLPDAQGQRLAPISRECPAKSLEAVVVYRDGAVWGEIALHYLDQQQVMSEDDRLTLKMVSDVLTMALERQSASRRLQAERDRAVAAEQAREGVFEALPYPVMTFSPQGTVLVANSAAEKMVRRTRAEIIGRPCHEIICSLGEKPDWCPLVPGSPDVEDQLFKTRDGRSFLISVKHMYDASGKLDYLLETMVDVTHRAEESANSETIGRSLEALLSDETLKHPERLLEDIRTRLNADLCYLVFDVATVSGGAVEPGFAALRGNQTNKVPWPFQAAGSNALIQRFETNDPILYSADDLRMLKDMYRNGAGERVFDALQTVYARKFTINGLPHGVLSIGFNRDHTLTGEQMEFLRRFALLLETAIDRSHTYSRLIAERDRAVAAEQAQSQFFSTVSHDIRTPLNAVIGFSELLKAGIADEAQRRKALDSILTSGQLLLGIVDDVLDISKMGAQRLRIKPDLTDVGQLAADVLHTFDAEVADGPVCLREDISRLPLLLVDARRLRRVLLNLISNAVKFTRQGSVTVHVAFTLGGPRSVAAEGGMGGPTSVSAADATERVPPTGTLVLSVSDTGCGISAENQQRIMEPFFQVSQYGSLHGAGLGLTVCTQLVKLMGGTLDVASELGKGSTFIVTLPKVRYTEEKVETLGGPRSVAAAEGASGSMGGPRSVAAAEGVTDATERVPPRRRRVLIADDAPLNLIVIKNMLLKLDVAEVVSAKDGAEALQKMREDPEGFDVVLTDLWMPKLDGNELAREIRNEDRWSNLPLYAVTADVEAQKTYRETGFTGLLLKPVTLDKLASIVG